MPLEGQARQLFEEIKYKWKFPPRVKAASIKSELAVKGLGRSGALVQQVTAAYFEVVEKVLDEFADAVLDKRDALGLTQDVELTGVLAEACQQLFTAARSILSVEEFRDLPEYGQRAMAMLEERHGPVWEHLLRKVELRKLEKPPLIVTKEREQKFGILLSPTQASRDFEAWAKQAEKQGNPIAVLFVDLDHFKILNERYTHAKIDQTILPVSQELLVKLIQFRGEAYRYGGEEFILILLNLDLEEARTFAEKVRQTFARSQFQVDDVVEVVTVSIGVAVWPIHGESYETVLEAANKAEVEAKQVRNIVKVAGGS